MQHVLGHVRLREQPVPLRSVEGGALLEERPLKRLGVDSQSGEHPQDRLEEAPVHRLALPVVEDEQQQASDGLLFHLCADAGTERTQRDGARDVWVKGVTTGVTSQEMVVDECALCCFYGFEARWSERGASCREKSGVILCVLRCSCGMGVGPVRSLRWLWRCRTLRPKANLGARAPERAAPGGGGGAVAGACDGTTVRCRARRAWENDTTVGRARPRADSVFSGRRLGPRPARAAGQR